MYFLQSAGAYEAALADLTRVVHLRAGAGAFYWRGMAFYHLQLYAAAIADFTEAIAHQPEYLQLYYWRGLSAYQLQDYAAALSDLDQVLSGSPQDDSGRFWRGVVLHRLGYHEPALVDLDGAVTAEPDNLLRLAWRGRICLALARWEQARQDFARVLTGDDPGGQGAYVVAGGLAALEQAAFACAWLQRVAQLDRRRALAAVDDPDFAPIRDNPTFQDWLASLPATP
jgi:tetratricopeptide (TPR) repeat protein